LSERETGRPAPSAGRLESEDPTERFSLVVGGPFHTLLRRLGLTAPDQLPTAAASIALAAIAWLPPALLAVAETLAQPGYDGTAFLWDATVYTRFVIAIAVMVATERYADRRILLITRHFREARLLGPEGQARFAEVVRLADRRSSSAVAEGIILAMALAWSWAVQGYVVAVSGVTWEGTLVGDAVSASWAGEASGFVSTPLFLFLAFRWMWRFGVWTGLLYRISRLPLQLTPLHPDRSAGLGFLAIYPNIFSGYVFALACVIASSILKDLRFEQHDPDLVWFAIGAWIALAVALFVGPLLVFVRPLYLARERALLEYGRLASQHHLAFHRTWLGTGRDGEELLGSADPSSAGDLNASVQAVSDIRLVPVDRAALVQLVLAAGAPMLAVAASQVPLFDLLKFIAGTIL